MQIGKRLIEHGAKMSRYYGCGHAHMMDQIHILILCKYLTSVGVNINLLNDMPYKSMTQASVYERICAFILLIQV